jgi:hypothetical protein
MCILEEKQSGEGIRFAVLSLCLLAARTGLDELEGGSSWRESYGVGLLEGYYLPSYGIEWMPGVMGATAFLAGYWIRISWD